MPQKIGLEDLARMVKSGFDEQTHNISEFRGENQKEHKAIERRLLNLEFIATEMVRAMNF